MQTASSWAPALAFPAFVLALFPACGGNARYPAPAVATTARALMVTPVATDPRVDDLERRVTKLENQPAARSTSAAAVESPTWSCAAQCVTKYHCTANGDSNVTFNHVDATGATPLEAFKNLRATCAKDDELEVSVQCVGGRLQETDATLVNACVKN